MDGTGSKFALIKTVYYLTANTLIFLALVLLFSHAYLKRQDAAAIDNFAQHFCRERRDAYRHMSDREVNELLNSTWNPKVGGWLYDDWVGFKEAPRKTRYVNVNEHGIRQNSGNPMAMDELNGAVWFFGGSTTFGYGVADSETVPAQLEKMLGTRVVNMGRGYFYSAQENHLLRKYLKDGYRPKEVIFLDGVNERCDIEVYQSEMQSLFREASRYSWDFNDLIYPVTALSDQYLTKLGIDRHKKSADNDGLHELSCKSNGKTVPLTYVLQQNLLERQSLCRQYALNCTTYVQPFAGVHGIHSDLKTYKASDRKKIKEKFDYLKPTFADSGSVFITDSLDKLNRHAYVDDCHYSAEASGLIAQEIAQKLDLDSPR